MFQNYALYSERKRYEANNFAIYEQIAIDDFISRAKPEEVEKAIKFFAYNPDAAKRKGGVVLLHGKKIRINFVDDPKHPGDYIAKFAYVDNPNAATDLTELVYIAIRGLGTDEDAIYSVASAYRQYCQDLGKDEVAEMNKLATEYKKRYNRSLYDALWEDMNDVFDRDKFDNYLMRGLYLQGKPEDVGANYAKRIADFTKPEIAANTVYVDAGHSNAIRFLLGCPLKYLPAIDATFKKISGGKSILEHMKETGVDADTRDVVNSYFMGANLAKKDDKFQYASKVVIEGPNKVEPSYTMGSDMAL